MAEFMFAGVGIFLLGFFAGIFFLLLLRTMIVPTVEED